MLQIRLSVPNFISGVAFNDPIILENADNVSLVQSVTLGQESISFTLPRNDAKADILNERKYASQAYTRWWECWDTESNERLGYGPIETIDDSGAEQLKVSGPSRHALLSDFSKTVQTFYYPIRQFLDDLRFENIAGEPRTATIINDQDGSDYHGLSLRTKDNAIDENIGYLSPGRDTPARGQLKTDSYWSGTGRSDYLVIDLGDDYSISKTRVLLPWWGGLTINNNRVYDWSLQYSTDNITYNIAYAAPSWPTRYTAMSPSTGGATFHFGEATNAAERNAATVSGAEIAARYWKIDITGAHASYSNSDGNNLGSTHTDEWDWECAGSDSFQGGFKQSPSNGTINTKTLKPDNDCYASVVEFEADRKILNVDFISSLYYQQIDNENLQITYNHTPDPSETIATTTAHVRKYEPGVTFRRASFSWSTTDSGTLDVYDQFNTHLYSSSSSAGSHSLKTPANARFLRFVGSDDVVVTSSDCWLGVLDPLSFEGRYSYTPVISDTAVLHFRGVSVKWFATIPEDATPGEVSIELRSMAGSTWNSWTTIVSSLTLPVDVAASKVWEITYESGTLLADTTYELRITNLNGGYVAIDAFAGYWEGSFQQLNEDDPRFYVRFPNDLVQKYDETYSFQSVYEYPTSTPAFTRETLNLRGDRIIIYSLKKNGAGTIKIGLTGPGGQINIPGGDADGTLTVNLDNAHTIPQAVIFDTDDIFGGMEWGFYAITFYQRNDSPGPMYIDGIGIHGESGISTKFEVTSNLEILQNTAEVLQMEPAVTEAGLRVVPRIGVETVEIIREGGNTVISIDDVKDVSQVATMLQVTGSDIDGLPLTGLIEDKTTRSAFGRTIQRSYDLRNVADQFTLIGAARTELTKRRRPQNRVTIHTSELPVALGDSFTAFKKLTQFRLRAMEITRTQARSSGTTYEIACIEWPLDGSTTSPLVVLDSTSPEIPPPLTLTAQSEDSEVVLDW